MISQLAGIFSPGRRSRCSDASASEGGTPRESRGPGGLQHLQAALNAAFEVPDGSEPPETEAKASGEAGHALETEQEACSEQAPLADEEKALPCDDDQSDEDMPEAPETEQAACSEQAPADEEAQGLGEGPAKALETEQEACGEPPDAEALPCDDDMSDEEAPEAEQAASEAPPEAESTGDQVPAEDAEVLPCDDDMSDEVEGERSPETREVPNAAETRPVCGEGALATPRRQSVASKVAQCKARLAELQAMKAQKLEEEDYMGAHEAKQMIQDQEAELQALRLEGTPTPARAAGEAPTTWRPAAPGFMELPGEEPFLLPVETFDKLYGYQRQGVAWMANLFRKKHGGVLADEMGLGKTIQVCALLNGARKAGATHALLVMPVTLLDQWGREARLWCPGWPVYVYYGTAAQRAKALRGLRRPMGGLLLTSYSLVSNCEELLQVQVEDVPEPTRRRGRPPGEKPSKRRKLDDDDGEDKEAESEEEQEPEAPGGELPVVGSTRPWDLVICDEAHRMKNMSSLLAKSLRKLKSNSRLLLTGTPVQNALQDLWALMDFAQPGLLGNHATFVKTFSEPIDRGSVRGAKVWAVELKKHLAEQLRALISPHLLRRTKTSTGMGGEGPDVVEDVEMEDNAEDVEGAVKKLPPKKETLVWLHPSEQQVAMYKKVLENSEVIREACHKSKLGIEVFRAIGLLKRLCNHPLLLLRLPKVKDWAELLKEVQEAEAELSDPEDKAPSETSADVAEEECRDVEAMLKSHSKEERGVQKDVLQQSAKLQCLSRLLPELAQRGHRTLVFSQSARHPEPSHVSTCEVKMLDLIQICLRCLRIDGLTEAQARAEKARELGSRRGGRDGRCMLLTTAVGGVGLNLTAADRVVVVAWNPATDAQAVDRAYRIGQTKEVHVYRLIMSGLVEDKMFRLQVFKMGLTRTALEADQQHRYFTALPGAICGLWGRFAPSGGVACGLFQDWWKPVVRARGNASTRTQGEPRPHLDLTGSSHRASLNYPF
ncbi:unnamed protein product [Effrenium voratum]|nr:unnamed protein product [Effrenium voratum]